MTAVLRRWNEYWFRPTLLVNLALSRIIIVAVQLYLLVTADQYNHERLRELSTLPDFIYDPLPMFRLLTFPFGLEFRPSLEILLSIYAITLAAGMLALIGLKTNLSLLLFVVGITLMQAFSYSFGDLHHPEALMIITLSVLAVSPAGRVLSVDYLQSRRRSSPEGAKVDALHMTESLARWPLLLTRWMFAIIYLDAAASKLGRSGLDWMNGYTLQYYLLRDGLRTGHDFGVWLADHHNLVWLLSWTTILFEGTFFLVLIFPRLAWVYVPLGLALHIGMCATLGACFYQYMAIYAVFVPWAPICRALRHRLGSLRSTGTPGYYVR